MPVYILTDASHSRLKIGYSATPAKRIQAHRSSNPGLEVLVLIENGDRRMEQALHRLLRGHRCAGATEWYWDSAEVRRVLAGVLAQVSGGGEQVIASAQEFGAFVGARQYSKDFELEADRLGAEIAYAAGFDPRVGAAFFDRIPDPGDQFLGSHPANADRKRVVAETVAQMGG